MLVSSALVLTALTATGLYVRNRNQKEEDGYVVDFTALEDAKEKTEEIADNQNADTEDGGTQLSDLGELDYDPNYHEEAVGEAQNQLGSLTDAAGELAAENAEEALEANASAIAESADMRKTDEGEPASGQDAEGGEEGNAEGVSGDAALEFKEEDGLVWPVVGNVLINYSMDKTVYFATLQQYKYNPAIIIAATQGENITAAADGKVTSVYQDPEIGTAVVVDLGSGYELTYGQLCDLDVQQGDMVKTGDLIGKVAEPTKYYSVEGCNAYFKLTKDGEPVNPLNRLG